ncbi:nucleolar protein Nop56 related protein [Thermoplasma acidophilum]|uniref:Nucleolar protein Nop56 related protein n=1 Tax=Thermoplasma acidophilum (strain ATCC 25905 / DSM 1728 / JCM 9062 / NBRC 15155 / AMRC-C165) TaxID=273075 RepID=Q9HIT5_THEAC|nr:nucleolar protein Nop56 related protein [Thermoplasma acidophilum]
MMERIMWYGSGKRLFKNLDQDYIRIFKDLREGRIPELDGMGEIPDLRKLLIEYGKERIREEFTPDQALIKVAAVRNAMDEIINKYYEKCLPFSIPYGISQSGDPCQFFRNGLSFPDISAIFRKGTEMCDFRSQMDDAIRTRIKEIMPNTADLVGPKLAMDLLERSRGLRRLALMPASSIQMLGAEKALFQSLGQGKKNPKYGVIFKFPGLSALNPKARGRIARIIANKVAITARADLLGTHVDSRSMREDIEEKIRKVKK